jgi:predicted amidohydrolase YtcJ
VAAQAGESEKWGQIKTGFRADLVAFDCDLTQVPNKDLLHAKVTNTWVAGIKVFDSQESSCGTNSL